MTPSQNLMGASGLYQIGATVTVNAGQTLPLNIPAGSVWNLVANDGRGNLQYQLGRKNPSIVPLATPFYLSMTITPGNPAMPVAGENINTETIAAPVDLTVYGAISDSVAQRGTFNILDQLRQSLWSSDQIPIRMICGLPNSYRPIIYWQRPIYLKRGQKLSATIDNVNGEPQRTIVLICEQPMPLQSPFVQLEDRHLVGQMGIQAINSQFTNTLNELTQSQTEYNSANYVIDGFNTDLRQAFVRVTGVWGERWMLDFIPIWGLGGPVSESPTLMLRRPYAIPINQYVTVEFQNVGVNNVAEPSGSLYTYGQFMPVLGQTTPDPTTFGPGVTGSMNFLPVTAVLPPNMPTN